MSLLISGLNGFICDECAEQAHDIVKETFKKLKKESEGLNVELDELPKPKDIKAFLDGYVIGQDRQSVISL